MCAEIPWWHLVKDPLNSMAYLMRSYSQPEDHSQEEVLCVLPGISVLTIIQNGPEQEMRWIKQWIVCAKVKSAECMDLGRNPSNY